MLETDGSGNVSWSDIPEELPTGGSDGQMLKTDGSGNSYWADTSVFTTDTLTLIADTDGDTKIEAEQNSDEDYLRFVTADTEAMTIDDSGRVGIGTVPTDNLNVTMGEEAGASLMVEQTISTTSERSNDPVYQTFKATESGVLAYVELYLYAPTTDRTVSIYEGEGTGGKLLASVYFNVLSTANYQTVPLSGAKLVAGQTYSLYTSSEERWSFSGTNPYADGYSSLSTNYDHRFRVYVYKGLNFSVSDGGVSVEGTLNTNGNADIGGDANIAGNADVKGNADIDGDASVGGTASITGTANIGGAANVAGNADVKGNADIEGALSVDGGAHHHGQCGHRRYDSQLHPRCGRQQQ